MDKRLSFIQGMFRADLVAAKQRLDLAYGTGSVQVFLSMVLLVVQHYNSALDSIMSQKQLLVQLYTLFFDDITRMHENSKQLLVELNKRTADSTSPAVLKKATQVSSEIMRLFKKQLKLSSLGRDYADDFSVLPGADLVSVSELWQDYTTLCNVSGLLALARNDFDSKLQCMVQVSPGDVVGIDADFGLQLNSAYGKVRISEGDIFGPRLLPVGQSYKGESPSIADKYLESLQRIQQARQGRNQGICSM